MGRELRPGDMVRVYHGRAVGVGVVANVRDNGYVEVVGLPDQLRGVTFHPKQLRRLVKRERRKVWINWSTMPKEMEPLGNTEVSRIDRSNAPFGEWIEFTESPRRGKREE